MHIYKGYPKIRPSNFEERRVIIDTKQNKSINLSINSYS